MIEILERWPGGSYFYIAPVKAIGTLDTLISYSSDSCLVYKDEIAIEEDFVFDYLYPFLNPHFNGKTSENANRINYPDGTFDWHGDNFFTFEQMRNVVDDIRGAVKLLKDDFDSPALDKYRKGFNNVAFHVGKGEYGMSDAEKNAIAKKHKDVLIDFYERFAGYVERLVRDSEKEGFILMTFCGP